MDAIAHAATRRLDSSLHAVGTPTPAIPVESVRTLSVTADYRLSEAGRKASLLNGGNGRAEQRVKVAVPLTRLHLVHVDANGVARLKLRPQFRMSADHRVIKIKLAPVYDHPPTIDELFQDAARNHELERAYHAQRTTAQAARRETLDEWRNQVALEFLGEPVRPAATFAYITGWRIDSEVLSLEWRQVDSGAGEVRLDPGKTKNGEGRTFPMTRELRELLDQQRVITENLQRRLKVACPRVFHRAGRPIKSFRVAFRTACTEAGCPGRVLHDFRRTAVRNLVRAGIPERVAMQMTGHKTRSVFERYNIVSAGDLREAAKRLDAVTGTISGTIEQNQPARSRA